MLLLLLSLKSLADITLAVRHLPSSFLSRLNALRQSPSAGADGKNRHARRSPTPDDTPSPHQLPTNTAAKPKDSPEKPTAPPEQYSEDSVPLWLHSTDTHCAIYFRRVCVVLSLRLGCCCTDLPSVAARTISPARRFESRGSSFFFFFCSLPDHLFFFCSLPDRFSIGTV